MIVGGCVGGLATSTDTVQFFVSARSAWVFGAYNAIWAARKYGSLMTCYASSISLYLVYRIFWGLCGGGKSKSVSPDYKEVLYALLDLLAKPLFGIFLLWAYDFIDRSELTIQVRRCDAAIVALGTDKHGTPPSRLRQRSS